MNLEVGSITQNSISQDYADKVAKYAETKDEIENYFTESFQTKIESFTGKSLEEMQEEVAQRREGIEQAIKDKDLDTAVDLIAEDGLLGRMFKSGWETGKSIVGFFKNLFD